MSQNDQNLDFDQSLPLALTPYDELNLPNTLSQRHLRLGLAILLLFFSWTMRATEYQVGTARIDITPDYPVRLSGFGFRRTESEGISHRIWAKALAIDDSHSGPAILISVDNLGLPASMVTELARELEQHAGINPERVSVLATHTHTAPMLSRVAPTLFGTAIPDEHKQRIDQYTRDLQEALKSVALAALRSTQPATLEFGIGSTDFAVNRRTKGGPVDHDLPALIARNTKDQIIAVYTNYACHCVTLSHNKISGDWAGYAQTEIEKLFPSSVAMVGIGCGADANPSSGVIGDDTDTAREQGKKIANGITQILGKPRMQVTGPIDVQSESIQLPFAPLPSRQEWEIRAKRDDAVGYHARVNLDRIQQGQSLPTQLPYRVQTWSFGQSMAWVLLPGEVVVDYATRLKHELDESKVWVTAYANDSPCYIPSERILKEGGYEGGGAMVYYDRPTRLASGIEDKIVHTVHSLIPAPFHPPYGTDGTAPKTPQEALQCFQTHPDLEVQLVASEPLVVDPVAIQWDLEGHLWVAEMHDYPLGLDGGYEPGGRIKTLKDTDGDGEYDQATIFADKIPFPTGLMPTSEGLLIGAAPNILLARDLDHDGKADQIEPLFTGFADHNYQARVNSFAWGLDNWIYAANGLFGGTIAPREGGPATDTRGHDFRFRINTPKLELVSGLTQQGRARDDFGNWFGCQNGVLIQHYPLEQAYLSTAVSPPAAHSIHWRDQDPGKLFPISRPLNRFNDLDHQGRVTSACGLGIYRDRLLGKQYEGNAFICEPVHNLVRRVGLDPYQGTFSARRADDEQDREFLSSTDPWFRPAQAITGPDGGLWIVDMYRFLMEHPIWIQPDRLRELDPRAGEHQGRIYRIVSRRSAHTPPAHKQVHEVNLLGELAHQNGTRRDLAQQAIIEGKFTQQLGDLIELAETHPAPNVRLQALCTLDGLKRLPADLLLKLSVDPHPEIRAHVIRLAESQSSLSAPLLQALTAFAEDLSPTVRTQLAYSIKQLPVPDAGALLAQLLTDSRNLPYLSIAALSSADAHLSEILNAAADGTKTLFSEGQWDSLLSIAHQSKEDLDLAEVFDVITAESSQLTQDAHNRLIAKHWDHISASLTAKNAAKNARALFEAKLFDDPQLATATLLLGRERQHRKQDIDLLSLCLGKTVISQVKIACIDALARIATQHAFESLTTLQAQLGPSSSKRITARILERPVWTKRWLSLQTNSQSAPNLTPLQRSRLINHSDKEIRAMAKNLLLSPSSQEIRIAAESFKQASSLTGDPNGGRQHFEIRCSSCHALHGIGTNIGPNLMELTDRSADHLINEILDPNRAALDGYIAYEIEQRDGTILSGLLTEETDEHLVLIAPNQTPRRIERAAIQTLRSTGRSLMPDGLAEGMSNQDMADLLAFINQNHQQTPPPRDPATIATFILDNAESPTIQKATIDLHYALADKLIPHLLGSPSKQELLHYIGFISGKRDERTTIPSLLQHVVEASKNSLERAHLALLVGLFNGWAESGQNPSKALTKFLTDEAEQELWKELARATPNHKPADERANLRSILVHRPLPGSQTNWNGFTRHDFSFENRAAIVVAPEKIAAGKPWIWRARFFGHQPQLDISLLKLGYHLVYLDVANEFGAPSAVEAWDQFHSFLENQHGFHYKALLEGMSRGGLIIYNWALVNPQKVAGIYADAPVLDFNSWPGGPRRETNRGQQQAWLAMQKAYGFSTDAEAQAYQGNPVIRVKPLVDHEIPLFHVCGGADEVVPYSENTGRFKRAYHLAGGKHFREIVKPRIGHHPHSIPDPKPLVEFVKHCYSRLSDGN